MVQSDTWIILVGHYPQAYGEIVLVQAAVRKLEIIELVARDIRLCLPAGIGAVSGMHKDFTHFLPGRAL